jgi:hypothetical protein
MGKTFRKFRDEDAFDINKNWKRERREARKHKSMERASVFSQDSEENSLDNSRAMKQRPAR